MVKQNIKIYTGLVRNQDRDRDRDGERIFLIRTLATFSGPEEWVWYPFVRS